MPDDPDEALRTRASENEVVESPVLLAPVGWPDGTGRYTNCWGLGTGRPFNSTTFMMLQTVAVRSDSKRQSDDNSQREPGRDEQLAHCVAEHLQLDRY